MMPISPLGGELSQAQIMGPSIIMMCPFKPLSRQNGREYTMAILRAGECAGQARCSAARARGRAGSNCTWLHRAGWMATMTLRARIGPRSVCRVTTSLPQSEILRTGHRKRTLSPSCSAILVLRICEPPMKRVPCALSLIESSFS
ncbi:hypothetical protein D3C78_1319600 [compost metagenome]